MWSSLDESRSRGANAGLSDQVTVFSSHYKNLLAAVNFTFAHHLHSTTSATSSKSHRDTTQGTRLNMAGDSWGDEVNGLADRTNGIHPHFPHANGNHGKAEYAVHDYGTEVQVSTFRH